MSGCVYCVGLDFSQEFQATKIHTAYVLICLQGKVWRQADGFKETISGHSWQDSSWDSSLPIYSALSLHQAQDTITLPNPVTCSGAVSSSHLLTSAVRAAKVVRMSIVFPQVMVWLHKSVPGLVHIDQETIAFRHKIPEWNILVLLRWVFSLE